MPTNETWVATLVELRGAVDQLTRNQAHRIDVMNRAIRLTVVGLIFDVLLTALALGLFSHNQGVTNRLDQQARDIKAGQARTSQIQIQTSSEVLCPVWIRFLRSFDLKGPAALRDPVEYRKSFDDIEAGARILKCSQTKRGK